MAVSTEHIEVTWSFIGAIVSLTKNSYTGSNANY